MTKLAAIPNAAETALKAAFAARNATPVRLEAFKVFEAAGLPHRRVEEWKWTDLRRVAAGMDFHDPATDALTLTTSREPDARGPIKGEPELPMAALAGALAEEALIFDVKDAETLSLDFDAAAGVGARVVVVRAAAGASVVVRESYRAGAGAFATVAIRFELGAGATLERVVRQTGEDGVLVVTARSDVPERVTFRQTTLAFGAKLARLETHLALAGEGAHVALGGAYLLDGERHADQTTVVDHAVPNATTEEVFKGAVMGRAEGVFQGRIHVGPHAQKTDARMRHDALILEAGASVNAKPELIIFADDVQCAHGNTVGAVDPMQLYYLQSRGLPEARARALLTEAFVSAALDGVTDEATRDALRQEVRDWLEARS